MRYSLLLCFFVISFKTGVEGFNGSPPSINCNSSEECQSIIKDSVCQYTCVCPDEKLLSSDGTKCVKQVFNYGEACEDNIQCSKVLSTGGVCMNNKCQCKAGYHYLKGRCWKNVDLHESCLTEEQCFSAYEYAGLECVGNTCRCRSQYYERMNSGCRRKMNINDACNLDIDCPERVKCENMVCVCDSKSQKMINATDSNEAIFSPSSFKTRKRLFSRGILELGDSCKYDTECENIKFAVCLDNRICACKPPKYVASEDNKQCLPTARGKVQDIQKSSCKEHSQCAVFGGNSFCKDRHCACKNGTYWEVNSQFCWTIRQVGEKCDTDEDCLPSQTFAKCKKQVCTCQEGYHEKRNICLLNATKVGDYCEEDDECLFPNSFCNESDVCACKENYYALNGRCLPGVKSNCDTDADCNHLNNTKCKKSNSSFWQCLCIDNHVSSNEGNYCLPVVKFGEKCEESFQCLPDLGELGECMNGICRCKNKTHIFYGKCYRSKFAKEPCTRLQDCHPGNDTNSVICLNAFCSCNYGYELDWLGFCVKTNSAAGMKPYLYLILAAFFSLR